MSKFLFINPPSSFSVYSKSKLKAVVPVLPVMSLAMLASSLLEKSQECLILDLAIERDPLNTLKNTLNSYKPDYVGLTATTPIYNEIKQIAQIVRDSLESDVTIIAGGAHVSALPEQSLKESEIDIVVRGEGEETLEEIADKRLLSEIKGIIYKENGTIKENPPRTDFKDLDNLPIPKLELFKINEYKFSRVISRTFPVAPIEFSRGCPFNCTYCNKNIMGRKFRVKSPKRVVEELKYFKKLGYKEVHVIDDQFSANMDHAKQVLDEILKNNLKFYFNLRTGVRVDRVDREFLKMAKKAGCYQVGIGFESGNQKVLDSVNKGITLEDSIRASALIKEAGIECAGFYMLGFLDDTVDTMDETINFAIRLNTDFAKATIVTPFPGTILFEQYEKLGLVKSYDWTKYNFHTSSEVYDHPALSWDILKHYYNLFHKKYYLRPGYIVPRAVKGLFTGQIFYDISDGIKTFTGSKM